MGFACVSHTIKLHLEGALIHYIRSIQEDVADFAKAALEYKDINPSLSRHYSQLVESQNAFIEEIQEAKKVIKALPICKEVDVNYPKG